jgi:uncharacterized protein YceH (UPF0502 family)
VEERLGDLMRRDTPLVDRTPREPGQKENRYRCLLVEAGETAAPFGPADLETRVAALEDALQRVLRRLDAAE